MEGAQDVGLRPSSVANWPSLVPPVGPIRVEIFPAGVFPACVDATVPSGPTAQPIGWGRSWEEQRPLSSVPGH